MNEKQRYKCKSCGCNYTSSSLSRTPLAKRVMAIRLYLEGVEFRGIERLTGTPHTTVMSWVKKLGDDIEHFRSQDGEIGPVSIMELDEMWNFIQKKEQMLGLARIRPRRKVGLWCPIRAQGHQNLREAVATVGII